MPFNRRILGYLSWQGTSMLIQAVTQFGVVAILARFLTAEEFGVIAAANIAVTFVQFLAEGGLGAAIVRKADPGPSYIGSAFSVSLLIGLLGFVALAGVAVPFQAFYAMDSLALVVVVLGVGSLLTGMAGVVEGIQQREMRFKALFWANSVSWVLAYAIPAVALAIAGFGVWSIVIATLARTVMKMAILSFQCRAHLRLRWDASAISELLSFGFGLTQFRFWSWGAAQAVPFVVGYMFGQERLGQYYLATQLAILPSQHLASVVSAVYFPLLSRSLTDPQGAAKQLSFVLTVLFIPVTAMGLLLAVNADGVIRLVIGDGWSAAVAPFAILCLGAGLRSCLQITDAMNIARGDVYALSNRKAMSTAVMLACLFVTERFGLAGAATSVLVGHTLMLAITIPLIIRGLKIDRQLLKAFAFRNGMALLLVSVVNIALWRLFARDTFSQPQELAISVLSNVIVMIPIALLLVDQLRKRLAQQVGYGAST